MPDLTDVDVEMLRRAANACRNAQKQMTGDPHWFDWVPAHLERMADRATEPVR